MRTLTIAFFFAASLAFALSGCDEVISLLATPCETENDCQTGQSCSEGYCRSPEGTTPGRGGRGDGTGTTDPGAGDTDGTGGVIPVVPGGGDGGTCTPSCEGFTCGPDGCGGSCGTCATGSTCSDQGLCVAAAPAGLQCTEIIDCINDCANDACAQNCYASGTPTGKSQIDDILGCVNHFCDQGMSEAEYMACQEANCLAYFQACEGPLDGGGGGTEPTAGGCIDTVVCVLICDSEACLDGCFNDATVAGGNAALDYLDCSYDDCMADPDVETVGDYIDCAAQICPAEDAACAAAS